MYDLNIEFDFLNDNYMCNGKKRDKIIVYKNGCQFKTLSKKYLQTEYKNDDPLINKIINLYSVIAKL